MDLETYETILVKLEESHFAAFGGNRSKAITQLDIAIEDLFDYLLKKSRFVTMTFAGMDISEAQDAAWQKALRAINWLNGLMDKLGMSDSKFPTDKKLAEAVIRANYNKLMRDD